MSSLATKGLVKRFGRTTVVDNVDVAVSGGEIVGLLGPNGAGKTTCFYMICGLIRRDNGHIVLDGADNRTGETGLNSFILIMFYQFSSGALTNHSF